MHHKNPKHPLHHNTLKNNGIQHPFQKHEEDAIFLDKLEKITR